MKRTLVVAALALAVYVVYSVVYLFVSPDRNIQQIYLVPEDAAFIIQSSAPIEDWEKFSGSETWQCLKKAKSFEEVTKSVEKLDSVVKSNKVLLSLVGERDMLISLHKTRATEWDFLLILDMQKTSKMDLLKDQVETVLVMSGFTVTNRMHNGINILEMRDSETRDIFYIAFVDNHLVGSYTSGLVESAIDSRNKPKIGLDQSFIETVVIERIDEIRSQDKEPIEIAIELCMYCMKTQVFKDGNKRASVIFANHYLIAQGMGFLVIPEKDVPEFKKLLVQYYEGEPLEVIGAFLKERCWKNF